MTHTPGPWTPSADGYAWRVDHDTPHGKRVLAYNINEAEARLIAAAPDLLALLKAAVAEIDAQCFEPYDVWRENARAAIAKATQNTQACGQKQAHDAKHRCISVWDEPINTRQASGGKPYSAAKLTPGTDF